METIANEDDYMPFREVTRALGNSESWVCRLTKQGRLPYVTTPLGRLYLRTGVEKFIQDRTDRQASNA
jgi:predicted DNA-binding transcriptional regulator AlpA